MRKFYASLFYGCFLAFLAGTLPAQIPGLDGPGFGAQGKSKVTVELEVKPKVARPGELVTLTATLSVIPGWHVYGALQNPDYGSPTEFTLEKHDGLIPFGDARIPPGEPHGDEFMTHHLYGDVVLVRRVLVPADTKPGEFTLSGQLVFMSCDESRCDEVSESPWSYKLKVEAGEARAEYALQKVEVLDAKVRTGVRPGEAVDVAIRLQMRKGYHVFGKIEKISTPTTIAVTNAPELAKLGVDVGEAFVPDGEPHMTEGLDEENYYLVDTVTLYQRVVIKDSAKPEQSFELKGTVGYQVCDDSSCDLPATLAWTAEVAIEQGKARAARLPGALANPLGRGGAIDEASADDGKLENQGLLELILLAVGGALFALAMPCTYPMIPITISFFTKQADARGGNVLPLALTYGFGIIGIFVVIGLIFGQVIVPFATHWVTNLVIGVFFLVFALSLFGLFTLNPPKFLMNAAGKASTKGGYVGVFLMGATLVVTSFTCTAPFVGNVLAVGAQGGYVLVALSMAIFGLTMAIPFVFLALVPAAMSAMPSSGMWMNTLKIFLGFVEVAAALKFLSNVDLVLEWKALPREIFLFQWAAIFGLAGYYLLGRVRFKGETGEIGPGRLVASLGVLLLAVYFASGAVGNRLDWVTESIAPNYGRCVEDTGWEIVEDDFDKAREIAQDKKRLLLLNITGVT